MGFNPFEKRDHEGRWTHADKVLTASMKMHSGFTSVGGKPAKRGYSVAVPPPSGKDWMTLPHLSTSPGDIAAFREKFKDELAKPNRGIGGWSNHSKADGDVRDALDVVEVHDNLDDALRVARASHQDSIFDLDLGETINVKDPGANYRQPNEDPAKALHDALHPSKEVRAKMAAEDEAEFGPDSAQQNLAAFEQRANALAKSMKKNPKRDPKGLAKEFGFAVQTPSVANTEVDLAQQDGRLALWKQILPMTSIHYTTKDGKRSTLDFTREYLEDLAKNKAVDAIPFMLADTDNRHTMDPERYRGDVVAMEMRDGHANPLHDGLYGKIVFPNATAAKAVLDNPGLGVSARIREGVARSDGSTVNRGIIHVLGTLDPQVSGMAAWQTADLSTEHDEVLDLSNEEYQTMGKKIEDYTDDEVAAMSDTELDAFLGELGLSAEDIAELTEVGNAVEAEGAETREPVGASLSNTGSTDVDLANARAEQAIAQARATAQRLADAEWRETRSTYLAEGVPPFALDLAKPVLSRPDDMVIDLSNEGGADLNASVVVRGLLDAMKGMVDLSKEQGHGGTFSPSDTEDPDAVLLAQWNAQG